LELLERKIEMLTTDVSSDAAKNLQPVREPVAGDALAQPKPGIALCLSGGGYRAMLFHLGTIWRLNELGILKKLDRVSSVSGGSITAGVLGFAWNKLTFDGNDVAINFGDLVIAPIRELAGDTIDAGSIIKGLLLPRDNVAKEVAKAYRKHLFGSATLQDLPSDGEGPRFVINATNVQSGALWRFSKPYMGDYRVGLILNPGLELAVAVGASSAFPPFLSPVQLELDPADFDPSTKGDLQFEPYTSNVVLTDGGVYDNLGLETAWKNYDTILVSDGGGLPDDEPKPKRDWLEHTYRVLNLLYNQIGSLRKRQVVGSYQAGLRKGAYWGIGTNILDYQLPTALICPFAQTLELAKTATRLKGLDSTLQEQIINWGYAVCDAGIRKHVDGNLPAPTGFPYPDAGV
jgi:NTE family protein